MEEEFQESELIFQENADQTNDDGSHNFSAHDSNSRELRNSKPKRKKKKKKNKKNSLPVNIPQSFPGNSWFQCVESDFFDEEDDYGDDGELIPPHVILGRRIAGKMAFSVCTGNGRTLKGRDLREVRNSILKMTGFLET